MDAPFAPMPFVASIGVEIGMADGPLYGLMQAPEGDRASLAASIFEMGDAAKLSAGHRAVSDQLAPMMAGVAQFYQARAASTPFAALCSWLTTQLNGVIS